MRDVHVDDAPQPLDRVEMRAIRRDGMQFDSAASPLEPGVHQPGVMIARVVAIDMVERRQRPRQLD